MTDDKPKDEKLDKDLKLPHHERSLFQSLNAAVEGFVYVIKNERNMRIHFGVAFCVLLMAFLLGISRLEWILLSITVGFVLSAEMVNTIIEETMDFIQVTYHPVIQVIKDVSAGVVLISALNAIIVGSLIFSKYTSEPFELSITRLRNSPWQITLGALLVLLFIVVGGKVLTRRGTPFRGGIISGHAAAAFSLWTAVLFVQKNIFIAFATLLLAILVVQGRVKSKIHSFFEVVGGALLGILVTALFFQIFH